LIANGSLLCPQHSDEIAVDVAFVYFPKSVQPMPERFTESVAYRLG
jgi:hypothetical protein